MNFSIQIGTNTPDYKRYSRQAVSYLYVVQESQTTKESTILNGTKHSYQDLRDHYGDNLVAAFNYTTEITGAAAVGISSQAAPYSSVSIYKREVWGKDFKQGETIYHPVAKYTDFKKVTDYNVANDRSYEYIARATYGDEVLLEKKFDPITIHWDFWTITELHPAGDKNYTASESDVWKFRYNLSPSEQTQNISKTQQNNLTAYPTFAHGPANNISSSLTCLLGREMIQGDEKCLNSENWYKETPFKRLTSNEKSDMLKAWRAVCYSGNPKLLKDMKGNKYLIQIMSSSNTTNETWNDMPEQITFSWVEIGSLDGVMITGGN